MWEVWCIVRIDFKLYAEHLATAKKRLNSTVFLVGSIKVHDAYAHLSTREHSEDGDCLESTALAALRAGSVLSHPVFNC